MSLSVRKTYYNTASADNIGAEHSELNLDRRCAHKGLYGGLYNKINPKVYWWKTSSTIILGRGEVPWSLAYLRTPV